MSISLPRGGILPLLFAAAALCGAEFTADFKPTSPLGNATAKFPQPQKLPKAKQGDAYALIVKRGGFIPVIQLASALKAGEDYGYAFTLTRQQSNSSLCFGFTTRDDRAAAMLYVTPNGDLMYRTAQKPAKYAPCKIRLQAGKAYRIAVRVDGKSGKTTVNVPGFPEFSGKTEFLPGLDRFILLAQMPQGNSCAVQDLTLWRGTAPKTAAAPAPATAEHPVYAEMLETDFADTASLQSKSAKFAAPQKLTFEASKSGKGRALIVKRGGFIPVVLLNRPLTAQEDYGYSFDVTRLSSDSSLCCGFSNAQNVTSAMIWYTTDGRLMLRNGKNPAKYEFTGIKLAPNKTYHVSVAVNADARTVTVNVSGMGTYQGQAAFPEKLDRFIFSAQQPAGNRSVFENFRLYRKPGKIVCKENGVKGAEVKSKTPVSATVKLAGLTDGNCKESVLLPEKTVIEIILSKRIQTHAVQIYGGSTAYRKNPSGGCAPRSYRVEGLCNGAWVELAKADDVPDVCSQDGLADGDRFLRHDFKSLPIDRVRLSFWRSHDTGKRMTGTIPESARAMHLREIEFLTDRDVVQRFQISSLLAMEFRLPVYRNADRAVLTIQAANSPLTPKSGTMAIADPQGKIIRTRKIGWKSGTNALVVDGIGKYPPGRYMVTVDTAGYKFRRLLRIERAAEIQAPPNPVAMTGKKLFFTPDKYTFADCGDLDVVIGKTELIEQVRTVNPDKPILSGQRWYRTADGRYVVTFDESTNRGMYAGQWSPRYFISDTLKGPYREVSSVPPAKERFSPVQAFQKGSFPRPPRSGVKMEIYDPAKHGKIALSDLGYFYSYQKTDLGAIEAAPRHYYVTGRTKDGKFVLMTGKALFHDFGSYGENDFDDGFMSNDNFGGMWLSPDGKECYWAQGQTMRRNAPYAIEYDNAQTCFRMLTVYSTRDGIHWKLRNVVTVPDEKDAEGAQHYGFSVMQMAYGDLFLGQMFSYDGTAQQIYIDLVYSRNGVDFFRFRDRTPFVRSHNPEDWYFGHIFTNGNYVREGKYYYQQASYCTRIPHFAFEVAFNVPYFKDATAEMFRRRFEERELSRKLPYFDKAGGYEGLAKLTREAYYAVGVVKFRADGWFALKAGAKEGFFQTQPMTAKGKLTANAEIAKDGYIELELCDRSGKVLQKRRLAGDALAIPVFDRLPDGVFSLRGRMKNAKLYTLNFQ